MIKKYYILLVTAIALSACNDESFTAVESSGAVELKEVKASIEAGINTRSGSDVVYLEDRISRYQFVSADQMTFTKIERSENPIKRFQYKDVAFNCNASGAWERDKSTGYNLEEDAGGNVHTEAHPERIYWSDATSSHTFVGYSLPKDNGSFDWKKSAYYYDKDGTQHQFETYYGAIGNPLDADEEIDYNPATPTTETITVSDGKEEKPLTFGYSQKLRDEDLLLTYDNKLTADNSVANIKFRHALSSVRIIVNISGFYGTATDAYSKVSNMILKNQPTLYRWKQQSASVDALLTNNEQHALDELWTGESKPAYNQRKDMKLWNTKPEGTGEGAGKLFTFYGITVPQDADYFTAFSTYRKLEMSFTVTYPDPMKNDPVNKTISKTYTASLNNPVNFYPGKCTTIHISLNHKDESMTVGASYQDWEYEDTPDEGSLKKKKTFLAKAPALANRDQAGVTIVGDDKATADDATWLYERKDQSGTSLGIFDIYGNDGSATTPYTISTADQLLSFAYEVQSGRTFAHKYVKLDADITLQPSSSLPTTTVGDGDNKTTVIDYSKLISWIGIGTEENPFDGIFLANGRNISNLYGEHFFHTLGQNAVVDKINFKNVVEVQGCGVIAHENNGLICSCSIEGEVKQTSSHSNYTGSIVGMNNSFVIGCTHIGKVVGTGKVGGLVGYNNGTVMASYHSGVVEANGTGSEAHPTVGGYSTKAGGKNESIMFSCYYDRNVFKDNRPLVKGKLGYPMPTSVMQSNLFVREDEGSPSFLFNENGYTGQGPILLDVAREVVKKSKPSMTEEQINAMTNEQLIAAILPTGAVTDDVLEIFKYHFSMNTALRVFRYWIDKIYQESVTKGDDYVVHTNCHEFTKSQIAFLYMHYLPTHTFRYIPGAYPKIN